MGGDSYISSVKENKTSTLYEIIVTAQTNDPSVGSATLTYSFKLEGERMHLVTRIDAQDSPAPQDMGYYKKIK